MSTDLRRKWMAQLASLTYPLNPGQASEAFRNYLALLGDLPDSAFTRGSLEAVCEADHKMALRSYDEVSLPLRAWWRNHRPFVPALPAPVIPDRVPPTPGELAYAKAAMERAIGYLHGAPKPAKAATIVKARPLSDGHLLIEWQKIADTGNPFALARVAHLKSRMEGIAA